MIDRKCSDHKNVAKLLSLKKSCQSDLLTNSTAGSPIIRQTSTLKLLQKRDAESKLPRRNT